MIFDQNLIHRFGDLSHERMEYVSNQMEALDEYRDLMTLNEVNEPQCKRHRLNPMKQYNEEEFLERYRLSKESVRNLLTRIEDEIRSLQQRGDYNLAPEQKLLITLRYLATGNFHKVDGDLFGVHQSTASRTIRQVIKEIAKHARHFISFPNEDRVKEMKRRFYQQYGLPSIIGAIDCTHVRIKSPGGDHAEIFRNRKGFFRLTSKQLSMSMDVLPMLCVDGRDLLTILQYSTTLVYVLIWRREISREFF